ncbi:MAG: hypothetical protein MUC79_01435 [Thiobacillaceae bacterium]|jgi:hypothetical protein|nr:hypothetical protein [Thiobacillaceae bacterium]
MLKELVALQEENLRLREEVRRLRAAFAIGVGRIRPAGEGVSSIEARYPHVAAKAVAFWGTEQFLPYVNELLTDDRGNRQGFPFETLQELHFLKELHLEAYPHFQQSWEDVHAPWR